jgi:hypothetical protein
MFFFMKISNFSLTSRADSLKSTIKSVISILSFFFRLAIINIFYIAGLVKGDFFFCY